MSEFVEYRETMQAFARVVAQALSTVTVSLLELPSHQGKTKSQADGEEQGKTEPQLAEEIAAILKREFKYRPEDELEDLGLQRELGAILGKLTACILAEHALVRYLLRANHKRINLMEIAAKSATVCVAEAARCSQMAGEIAANILEFESTFTIKGAVLAALVERYVKQHGLRDSSFLSGPTYSVRFGWLTTKEVVIVFDYANCTDYVHDPIGRLFFRTISDLLEFERWGGSKARGQLERESPEHQEWLRKTTAQVFGDSAEWSDDFSALKIRKPLFA